MFISKLGLIAGSKLSGLLLSGCVLGLGACCLGRAFGVGLRERLRAVAFQTGTVVKGKTDVSCAFVLRDGTGTEYRVSQQYMKGGERGTQIGQKILVVGDITTDQYGRKWILPCTSYFSGIYTERHPLMWIARLKMNETSLQ